MVCPKLNWVQMQSFKNCEIQGAYYDMQVDDVGSC
jgi:hypothetical protein